jgi:hypothetical protein
MRQLTPDQIAVLIELVRQEISGVEDGDIVTADPAGTLIDLRDLRSDLQAMHREAEAL